METKHERRLSGQKETVDGRRKSKTTAPHSHTHPQERATSEVGLIKLTDRITLVRCRIGRYFCNTRLLPESPE